MKLILFLVFTLLGSFKYSQEIRFTDFLQFFIDGNQEIPSDYRKKFLDVGINCTNDCPRFFAKKFLFERPEKTMIVYEMECGAGGYCKQEYIAIYDINEKLIAKYPYLTITADCGHESESKSQLISDSLIAISSVYKKINCDSETIENTTASVKEVNLTKNPFIEKIYKVDTRRKYWQASMCILSDSLVRKLPADSLDYIRNEIYASKGYSFKTEKWKKVFNNLQWYIEAGKSKEQLSLIERLNIQMLSVKK